MPPRIDYYSTWAHLYDEQTDRVLDDVSFYVELASSGDGLVAEVGVGTGRIAIPIAATGRRVLGIDLHHEMLRIARSKARESGVTERLGLVRADMRRFSLGRPAELVLVTAQTFMYALTVADQLATLESCRAAVSPEGRLVVHLFNPDRSLIAGRLREGPDEWQPQAGHPWTAHRAEYWPTSQLTRGEYKRDRPDGTAEYASHVLRWTYRYEMEHLLARTGFVVEALYGDFDRAPFGEGSAKQLWVARPIG